MNNVNMIAAVDQITHNAKETNTHDAIAQYLTGIAANLPSGKMPNGYTAEQAANEIVNTCITYTEARDAQISKDELHTMIGKHCEHMTSEQAAEYLAGLHVFYTNLGNAGSLTQEQLAEQIKNVAQHNQDVPVCDHIEMLIDTLEPDKLPSIFGFVHQIEVDKIENQDTTADAAFVASRLNRHSDAQQSAIYAAVQYGEAVQGKMEGVPSEINPGMMAAEACMAADTAKVAADAQAGKITEEEAEEQLNLIERAFMATLAGLWAAIYMAAGLYTAEWLAALMLSAGLASGFALFMGLLVIAVFADDVVDETMLAYENATGIYIWLKKRTRPFRTKIGGYVKNAFQTSKEFITNLGKA